MMLTRPIRWSGEFLPLIGCGTHQGVDTPPGSSRRFQQLNGMLGALFAVGAMVIASSPMYGHAVAAVGGLLDGQSQVRVDPRDHHCLQDGGNDLELATAVRAVLHVDLKAKLQRRLTCTRVMS